jgi:hypothetical protein
MSSKNANRVPRTGGAKKGTPRTLLSSMTYEDIFKAMNMNLAASVETHFPKQERGGNMGLVPASILGCSDNPMHVITEI